MRAAIFINIVALLFFSNRFPEIIPVTCLPMLPRRVLMKEKDSHGFQSLRSICCDGVMFWFLCKFRILCLKSFSWSMQEQNTFDMKLKLDDTSCRRIVCIWWMNFSELEFPSLRAHKSHGVAVFVSSQWPGEGQCCFDPEHRLLITIN